VLRLQGAVAGVAPFPLAAALPRIKTNTGICVVGHAGGSELAFSFQDSELLDHEGPPDGKPLIPGVSRVHYRAPTQAGNPGSPVFNADWEVIAMHHMGNRDGLPRLNGKAGTYAAREGISIVSIREAIERHEMDGP
jgi:hypothetical protein